MKITNAILAAFIATAAADVTSIGCTVTQSNTGNTFKLTWFNIPQQKIPNICGKYEAKLKETAGQIGSKQTRVKSFSCSEVAGNIEATFKMDKQSCATQALAIKPAMQAAIDGVAIVGEDGCFC